MAPSPPSGPKAQRPRGASTTTLRTLMDARRAEGRRFAAAEAVEQIVSLCLDLQERHGRGERRYVHPSCVAPGPDGLSKLVSSLSTPPRSPRDRACLAPELKSALAGDAKASVFALGAILYEMVTGLTVGPGMPRPRVVDPTLTADLETVLEVALIADPKHRPEDLGALASALYRVAPGKSVRPPPIDPKKLEPLGDLDFDVRLSSLMPPPDVMAAVERVPAAPAVPRLGLEQGGLAALKAGHESDPRPRYVVTTKDGRDHGPFNAAELLQQIGASRFAGRDLLHDALSGQTRPIDEWEQFAPFAER